MRTQSICLAIVLCCTFASSQWVQTNGPEGGYITSFVVRGGNLFVGTDGGGVFLSTNNGASWRPVNSGLANSYTFSLTLSGKNLIAGT